MRHYTNLIVIRAMNSGLFAIISPPPFDTVTSSPYAAVIP